MMAAILILKIQLIIYIIMQLSITLQMLLVVNFKLNLKKMQVQNYILVEIKSLKRPLRE